MIKNKDRFGWFGASDTRYITGSFDTKTFRHWWLIKLGVISDSFQNKYTMAGTYFEHRILDAVVAECRKDKQIKIRPLRLRVNLDGNTRDCIYEVKTHKGAFELSRAYREQLIIQMLASGIRHAKILSYRLKEEDYGNFFTPIDKGRTALHDIIFDADFVKNIYLPRLLYLRRVLKEGGIPSEAGMREAASDNRLYNREACFAVARLLRKQGSGT